MTLVFGSAIFTSHAQAQSVLLDCAITDTYGHQREIVNIGDHFTICLNFTAKPEYNFTPFVPHNADWTPDNMSAYWSSYSSPVVSGQGLLFILKNATPRLRGNEAPCYGLSLSTDGLNNDLFLDLYSSNAILSSLNEFPTSINISDTYKHSGIYFVRNDNFGAVDFDITSYQVIPEPSTYAALISLAVIGFAIWRRYQAATSTESS
jgi:hypothetical protein